MMQALSPVRYFYRILCEIDTEESLLVNLKRLPGFEETKGDNELRFCEWAYTKIHQKDFYCSLLPDVLRPSEVHRLAEIFEDHDEPGIETEVWLGRLLRRHLNINEPCYPDKIINGLDTLKDFKVWARKRLKNTRVASEVFIEQSSFTDNPVASCRRATERLLKTITMFLYKTECSIYMKHVWENNLNGFIRPDKPRAIPLDVFITDVAEIGAMNHLLYACSKYLQDPATEKVSLRFLKSGTPLWSEQVFEAFSTMAKALNNDVHDSGIEQNNRLQAQYFSVRTILTLNEDSALHLPGVIQFFRKYDDGNEVYHYDGFSDDQKLVHFYEAQPYELHQPYLYLSATNPSCVDAVCTDIMPFLYNPI